MDAYHSLTGEVFVLLYVKKFCLYHINGLVQERRNFIADVLV